MSNIVDEKINKLTKVISDLERNDGHLQLVVGDGKRGLLDMADDYEKFCENVVAQKNDLCPSGSPECLARIDQLNAVCKEVSEKLNSKIRMKAQGLYDQIQTFEDEQKMREQIQRQTNVDDATKLTQLRALSLSQEQNIYKQKMIYSLGAVSAVTIVFIMVLFKSFGTK